MNPPLTGGPSCPGCSRSVPRAPASSARPRLSARRPVATSRREWRPPSRRSRDSRHSPCYRTGRGLRLSWDGACGARRRGSRPRSAPDASPPRRSRRPCRRGVCSCRPRPCPWPRPCRSPRVALDGVALAAFLRRAAAPRSGSASAVSASSSSARRMTTLPDSRSMRLPPELSPTSSRVDCSRRFSSSMCRLAGLKRVSRPHCVMARAYVRSHRRRAAPLTAADVRARASVARPTSLRSLDACCSPAARPQLVAPERALRGRDHYEFAVPDDALRQRAPDQAAVPGRATSAPSSGSGCFWGAEEIFWQNAGRVDDRGRLRRRHHRAPGLRGGLLGPDRAHRGRRWSVYDPEVVELRASWSPRFFEVHDPTQGMRQGNDVGTQYRSGIYYTDEAQRRGRRAGEGRLRRDARGAGLPAGHHRDRAAGRVLLRRGLPPAVPGEEPERLPLPQHDRRHVPACARGPLSAHAAARASGAAAA